MSPSGIFTEYISPRIFRGVLHLFRRCTTSRVFRGVLRFFRVLTMFPPSTLLLVYSKEYFAFLECLSGSNISTFYISLARIFRNMYLFLDVDKFRKDD